MNEVGRAVWGDKFFQYAAEQQQKAVLNYLKQKPCLLIWDNFEPVAGFPHGNEPLLSEHERDDLKRFLKELRGKKIGDWQVIKVLFLGQKRKASQVGSLSFVVYLK